MKFAWLVVHTYEFFVQRHHWIYIVREVTRPLFTLRIPDISRNSYNMQKYNHVCTHITDIIHGFRLRSVHSLIACVLTQELVSAEVLPR